MNTITSNDPEYLEFIGQQQSQFLMPISHFADRVLERLNGKQNHFGHPLPWAKTHDHVRLRPGEVTLWAGMNGHGKSMITGQVALWLARHSRVCIASLEMKPDATIARMIRQAAGCEQPSDSFAMEFMESKSRNIWIYDQIDTTPQEDILGMMLYAAKKLGIKHLFLDSLVKCGIAVDDYNGQKHFVDRLCWLAKSTDMHVHLIHHIRKPESEEKAPGKYDSKGAGEIVDLVDNVMIVYRNKGKERRKEAEMNGTLKPGESYDETEPDATLNCCKQRHGEWEGRIGLWFHPESQQYIPRFGAGPMPWPSPGIYGNTTTEQPHEALH